jgi:hypothetical protein
MKSQRALCSKHSHSLPLSRKERVSILSVKLRKCHRKVSSGYHVQYINCRWFEEVPWHINFLVCKVMKGWRLLSYPKHKQKLLKVCQGYMGLGVWNNLPNPAIQDLYITFWINTWVILWDIKTLVFM